MQKMTMPQSLQPTITFHSDFCDKHETTVFGQKVVKKVQKLIFNGHVYCPKCEALAETAKTERNEQLALDKDMQNKKRNVLLRKSIISDETIMEARFENYRTTIDEERKNKAAALDYVQRLRGGEQFNILLCGSPGVGKSHLSYSVLTELNDGKNECLFIDIDEMLRLIRSSFSNPKSEYTENYFIQLLSSVDYLCLDDLGAESGAISTDKAATDFVQRVLRAVVNARQSKTTIISTNLTSVELKKMYDAKLVSRILKRPKWVVFKETKDKRILDLPF